jgi:hypothetical protein
MTDDAADPDDAHMPGSCKQPMDRPATPHATRARPCGPGNGEQLIEVKTTGEPPTYWWGTSRNGCCALRATSAEARMWQSKCAYAPRGRTVGHIAALHARARKTLAIPGT